jgi:hypothetical protein
VSGWQRAHAPPPDEEQGDWLARCDEVEPDPSLRFATCLILYAPAPTFDEAARELGPALGRVVEAFGGRTLTFLHAWPGGRWPTRRRTPPVLAEAGRAFREMGAGKGFDGGIRVESTAAGDVIAPLMRIVRMDMGYGQVFLAPDRGPFAASLCQYGNLHVDVYARRAVELIREAAISAGLAEWTDGICDERWERGGAIPGRSLWLGARAPRGRG